MEPPRETLPPEGASVYTVNKRCPQNTNEEVESKGEDARRRQICCVPLVLEVCVVHGLLGYSDTRTHTHVHALSAEGVGEGEVGVEAATGKLS